MLNVDNVEKSTEYYKALGLKTRLDHMDDMPGMPSAPMGSVETSDSGLILWSKHLIPDDQPADTKAWVTGELGKGVLLTIGVPNAQKVWANAQKLRATIESPLEAQPWGGHGFNIVDLDGYVLNITDKFPGGPTPKKAKKAVKRVVAKARRAVKGKAKAKPSKRRR